MIALKKIDDLWRQNEKAPIDQSTVAARLFLEFTHMSILNVQGAKSARRICGCKGGYLSVLAMKINRGRDVDITDPIAVSETKVVFILYVVGGST